MIDIHCHILPDLDDGAKHMEESVRMARQAVDQGIHAVIATPHHKTTRYENDRQTVLESVRQLNNRLREEHIPLKVHPGQEIRIFEHMGHTFDETELLSLNETGVYVLIELPSHEIPRYTDHLIYNLSTQGYIPIIAHPERNQVILENSDILYEFVKNGGLSQVTASNLTGKLGKKVRHFSESLIEHNLAHVIASDAHHIEHRAFDLQDAYQSVRKRMDTAYVKQLSENAYDILNGERIHSYEPTRLKSKGLFGWFK
ncbi:protein-tyrosine phosphatase [Halolactibacillus halophilus]|uniref:Tyrosine-protein phosphatase n=1 Tax=Halolactibacillus halophilus TaxID=306540 RepID=A0A1I5QG54_9BACI|nr:CpsB/CapC family capsule biosynthesis tyrosine phosphatase [Halolactibacillus halophilus]GEM02119.1 tyrosine protein phosphatase [Halolactibacillus halophilus]SFP45107.1 protein-tyrosine phosphatase [Halolactibacillus halophilus]